MFVTVRSQIPNPDLTWPRLNGQIAIVHVNSLRFWLHRWEIFDEHCWVFHFRHFHAPNIVIITYRMMEWVTICKNSIKKYEEMQLLANGAMSPLKRKLWFENWVKLYNGLCQELNGKWKKPPPRKKEGTTRAYLLRDCLVCLICSSIKILDNFQIPKNVVMSWCRVTVYM